jgi:hypothetical protein
MTPDAFDQLVEEVAQLNGLSEDVAADLVARVGDTPETDDQDRVVVTSEDGVEHRLVWPIEE